MPISWISLSVSLCPPNPHLLPPSPAVPKTSSSFTRTSFPYHKAPQHPRFLLPVLPPPQSTSADAGFSRIPEDTTATHHTSPTTILQGNENHCQLLVRLLLSVGKFDPTTRLQAEDLVRTVRALTTSQSLEILGEIQTDGGGFETISIFNSVLKALVTADEFELASQLISNLSSYGLAPDHRTYSVLLACYCRRDDAFGAKHVLDHMLGLGLRPDVATFTALINSFCKSGRTQMAFQVLRIMDTVGCEPTICTYNCLLKGLCYVGKVEEAHDLLTRLKEEEPSKKPDIYSYTAVMNGLCKVGRSDEALGLVDEALKLGLTPNAVTYNTLLNGYFKEGRPLEGIDLLKRMKERRCSPDYVTYSTLLHGLLKWGEVGAALNVYREIGDETGVGVDDRLMNTLLRGLCRRAREDEGYLKHAYELFERMRSADCAICPLAYNMVIEAFCSGKEADKAIVSFREMIGVGTRPKSMTFTNVVRVLCGEGRLEEALSLIDLMMMPSDDRGVPLPPGVLFDTLIDELNRHAMFVGACSVYGSALKRGVVPRRKPRAASVTRVERSYRPGASHPRKQFPKKC